MTGTIGVDPCPHCGGTSDVKVIAGTSPKVRGWSCGACGACGTEWAVTVVNPRSWLDRLAATVVLRSVIVLAEQVPTLTDQQLRARLAALADVAPGGESR